MTLRSHSAYLKCITIRLTTPNVDDDAEQLDLSNIFGESVNNTTALEKVLAIT